MKTDYFNLIESKVNTEAILEKKISKLLKNNQKGGFAPLAAKYLAKKVISNPTLQNAAKKGMSKMSSFGKSASKNAMAGMKTAKYGLNNASSKMKTVGKKGISGLKTVGTYGKEKIGKPIAKSAKKSYNAAVKSYEKSKEVNKLIKNIQPNTAESPSYPTKLQVIPRDPHMTKKLSNKFTAHLEDIQNKINNTSEKINKQLKYVEEEQRILDEKKEILDEMYATSSEQQAERSWDQVKAIGRGATYFVDRFMSFIRWMLLLFIKLLIAFQPLIWAIAAIICVLVLILLIAWLIRGGKFKITDNDGNDVGPPTDDDAKEACSKNYGSCGPKPAWNWNNFIKNPIQYTLERNLNEVNNSLNIPDTLNKLKIQNPIYTLRKNFKLLNNDNFKTNRSSYGKQREDNVSFINYELIDEKISNDYFKTPSTQNANHSINLLKPKNIEWELPHLDYVNTDMSKLPESIKNYKDNTNSDSFSLNDTSKIIFPWKLTNDKWSLDCNTIFTNNKETGLYQDSGDNCVAKSYDPTQFTSVT